MQLNICNCIIGKTRPCENLPEQEGPDVSWGLHPRRRLWGRHYNKATPTLIDTPEGQVDRIWRHKQAHTVVILRDQTEECPLHWVWLNIPEWSSELMLELRWNWPNDISSGRMRQPQVRQYDLKDNKSWQRLVVLYLHSVSYSRLVLVNWRNTMLSFTLRRSINAFSCSHSPSVSIKAHIFAVLAKFYVP